MSQIAQFIHLRAKPHITQYLCSVMTIAWADCLSGEPNLKNPAALVSVERINAAAEIIRALSSQAGRACGTALQVAVMSSLSGGSAVPL